MEVGTLDAQLVQVEVSAVMVQNRAWNHQVTQQPNTGCTAKGKEITIGKRGYLQFPQQHSKTDLTDAHQQKAESTEGLGHGPHGPLCSHEQDALLLLAPAWMDLEDYVQSTAS